MIFKIFLFSIVFLGIIFVNPSFSSDDSKISFKEPPQKIKYGEIIIGDAYFFEIKDYELADLSTEIVLIYINTSHAKLKIINTDRTVHIERYFSQQACPNAMVVASGGFFEKINDKKRIPIGLVIAGGKTQSPMYDWKFGGVFHYTKGKYSIDPIGDFKLSKLTEEAIQSKPIVVYDSLNDIRKNDGIRWDRMSIGTTESNNLVIIGAFTPNNRQSISMYSFAEISIQATKLVNIKLKRLLALDGAGGAILNLRSIKRHYGYKKYNYITNVLCIVPKAKR